MQILLIDDEPRKAQPLIVYLKEIRGWSVTQATNPDVALAYLPVHVTTRFKLILLDIMMPPGKALANHETHQGRDTGIVLFDTLNERTQGTVPIIIYTARTDVEEYFTDDQRAAGFIQKPQTPRQVASTINGVLSPDPGQLT